LRREDATPIEDGLELLVHGKGRKTRTVPLYSSGAAYLADWLALRGDREGPLFEMVTGGEIVVGHGIGPQAMMAMLHRRAMQAGVQNLNWHDARRTLAGELLDHGADLSMVQKILGHSSPVTTANYDKRPEETRRKALRGLHMPYLGPRQKG